jgi:SAM-dependent methyltransferase
MTEPAPKPGQWSGRYAEIFKDQSVVDDYHLRPGYDPGTFSILDRLMDGREPKRVLDAGCGTGFIDRYLIAVADHVDAVDFSAAAIKHGRRLSGGDSQNLRWICTPMEQVEPQLEPPYALITAGASLHWMEWAVVLPMFRRLLLPGACLALVENIFPPAPWAEEIRPLLAQYSMNKEFQAYDNRYLARELETRRLFALAGEQRTPTVQFRQSVANYVQSFHSRNGLSRDRLGEQRSLEFGRRLTAIVAPYCPDGTMTLDLYSRVIWGRPHSYPKE